VSLAGHGATARKKRSLKMRQAGQALAGATGRAHGGAVLASAAGSASTTGKPHGAPRTPLSHLVLLGLLGS